MAERKPAEDDFNPRHRIVGAVILVALAVIFLPMLLREQPPETRTIGAADSPVPDTRIVVAPVTPIGPGVDGRSAPSGKGDAPPPSGDRTVAVPVEPLTDRAVPPASTGPAGTQTETKTGDAPSATLAKPAQPAVPAKTTDTPAKPVPAPKGWVVQVGAFSQAENAKRLHAKLEKKGYPVFLVPSSPDKAKTVRVDVGPFKDSTQAKAAQGRIQNEFGIQGIVRQQ